MTSAMPETTPVTEMGIERQLLAFKNVSTFAQYAAAKVSPRIAEDLQIVCILAESALSTRTPEAAQGLVEALTDAHSVLIAAADERRPVFSGTRYWRARAAISSAAFILDHALRHPLEKEG